MSFSIKQLRYFVIAAESGSVSGAARQIGISQSAITEALQDLERDLDLTLLERHARGVRLTTAGHRFLRHAVAILNQVADARRMMAQPAEPVGGTLNLGVTSLVSGYVMADLLVRFRRAWPQVGLNLVEESRAHVEHLLIGGELDSAALVVSNLEERDALDAEVIERFGYRAWLPLGHALASTDRISLRRLATEPIILLDVDEIGREPEAAWRRMKLRPNISFRTGSVEAVRSFVAAGAGVAVLPDILYRPLSLEGEQIVARPLTEAMPSVDVGLAWRRGSRSSAAMRLFLESCLAARAGSRFFR